VPNQVGSSQGGGDSVSAEVLLLISKGFWFGGYGVLVVNFLAWIFNKLNPDELAPGVPNLQKDFDVPIPPVVGLVLMAAGLVVFGIALAVEKQSRRAKLPPATTTPSPSPSSANRSGQPDAPSPAAQATSTEIPWEHVYGIVGVVGLLLTLLQFAL
jgi:hypothetical protein